MSEAQLFYLVVVAVYLTECATLVRKDSVILVATWLTSWRIAHPSGLLGSEARGLFLSNPVPPLGETLVAQAWPFSLSPEGCYAYTALTTHPEGRAAQDGPYLPWGAVRGVTVEEKKVVVEGTVVARADSAVTARGWAELLTSIAKAHPADREDLIMRAIRKSLDAAEAARRRTAFADASRWLRWVCVALCVHIFAVCPLVWMNGPILRLWPVLALVILGLMWTIAVLFFRAHAAVYGAATGDRGLVTFLCATVPTVPMRACDYLSRPLLAGVHPLAAVHALLDAEGFKKYARAVLLDTRQPIRPECRTDNSVAKQTEGWCRARLGTELEAFVRARGLDPADLTKPLSPRDSTSKSYCPRCDAQYALTDGVCSTCGDIPLIRFTADVPGSGEPPA